MARWALLADDMTGALDTALQFRKIGFRTVVSARPGDWPPDAEVIALSVESRRLPAGSARKAISDALQALRLRQPEAIYKKTDSLMRGNVGADLAALREVLAVDTLVFTPAFPTGGRTTIAGVHRLWGTPIAASTPGQDPVTPVRESHIPTLLATTGGLRVTSVPLAAVRVGPAALAAELTAARNAGSHVIVPDVETDADLETVAAAMASAGLARISAGAAGLAEFLARASGARALTPAEPLHAASVGIIVGTPNPHTRAQVARVLAAPGIEVLGLLPFERRTVEAAVRQARRAWRAGRQVLFDAVAPAVTLDAAQEEAQRAAVRRLAATLVGDEPGLGLVLTGGDTALAALQGMDVEWIELRDEVEWGVPAGLAVSADGWAMPVITKGGTMGGPDALLQAVRHLTSERAASGSP
ncbi:MAG: four-carbon acid sugar kinase family protein [Actinobacteria bacterium]|nr:four-carbon acid sugar kinase family protein [Actinomycetota bacterium]